jgi:hypothetical protein
VNVIAKSNIATAESSVIKLSDLKGPEGVATGSFLVNGPTAVGSSEFCIGPDPLRTSDAQTAAQHHTRDAKFVWTFESNALSHSENCFTIPQGEQVYIDVEVRNPIQADASVTAIFEANSSTDSAELSENLQFEFKSSALVDETTRNLIIIGLLLLGLIIPLALLYLLNFLTTKFLPVEQMVRAEYAVALQPGPAGKIVDQSGKPIQVDANDFRYLPDMPASKTLDLGLKGKSAARLPLFPLAAPWFEHQAPAGSRVISLYNGGSKSAASFASGQAAEISPNHADNWQLIIPDSEFLKPEGEALAGVLVVGSRMGNLPQYQNRVNEIASKPGLQRRVGEIRAALAAEATSTKPPKRSKGSAKSEGSAVVATPPATISAASIPGISNPAGGTVPPGQPGSPAIPGVPAPAPTGIPGVNPPAGTPGISNPNIPGAPKPPTIPGVNPPK